MFAIFVAGGESLRLNVETLARVMGCGKFLGDLPVNIRIGPLRGGVIKAFIKGLAESKMNARVSLHVPLGPNPPDEELLTLLEKVGAHVEYLRVDYNHRNDFDLENSDLLLVLPGEENTLGEYHRGYGSDRIQHIFVLDAEADSAEWVKRRKREKVSVIQIASEMADFFRQSTRRVRKTSVDQPRGRRAAAAS
jgi:hypothetical protein